MTIVTRVWRGKKEMATRPYFCGQVWDIERKLWETVTSDFSTESRARDELAKVLNRRNSK